MNTKIKLPTWGESYAREQNGGASALEKFISTWEPAGDSTEAAFRAMLERTLNDITDELRAENGRLRAELDEARELMDKALDGRAFYAVCQHCKIVQTIERHMVFEDESCACIVCGTDWHPERQEPEIFIDGDDIPF